MWWQILIGVAGGLIVLYAGMLFVLWSVQRRSAGSVQMRQALRLLPDVLRLVRRLAADRELPIVVRLRLILLLAYLASPIDLIPDFIPILGYADDVLVVAIVLRSVIRRAGPAVIERHWPGTPEGLNIVCQLAGLQQR
ncbi:MAG: DUF1232 domain-containing protein [Actinomycetota bacterium]|nr:DUF1232 domain-containing protein [Actinomycetota bacterium]